MTFTHPQTPLCVYVPSSLFYPSSPAPCFRSSCLWFLNSRVCGKQPIQLSIYSGRVTEAKKTSVISINDPWENNWQCVDETHTHTPPHFSLRHTWVKVSECASISTCLISKPHPIVLMRQQAAKWCKNPSFYWELWVLEHGTQPHSFGKHPAEETHLIQI